MVYLNLVVGFYYSDINDYQSFKELAVMPKSKTTDLTHSPFFAVPI